MRDPLTTVLALPVEVPWTVPVMGLAVAGLAFFLGRRLLVPRPAAAPPPAAPEAGDDVFLRGVTIDRRSAPRRKGNSVEVFLSDDSKRPLLHGWVVDRSVGGLCLLVEKPVTPGTILNVRARNAPESTPWIAVEIKTCRPEKGDWEVGCQFAQSPSWNVLLYFG